jgi:uncharacterized membrane protein YhfC
MFLYGIIALLAGIGLFAGAAAIPAWLHRRYRLPYTLLSVGVITYFVSLVVQAGLLQIIDRALLGILPIRALALGLAAGFSEEILRLMGFVYLARSTVTRPQALMVGAGHGLVETVYTGLIAVGLGLSLIVTGKDRADDLPAILSGALAESLNGILPVIMHMALSWIVLQVLLRGEWYWLFLAIFGHAVVEIMAALLGPNEAWPVAAWRALVAVMSAGVIVRVRAPHASTPKSSR